MKLIYPQSSHLHNDTHKYNQIQQNKRNLTHNIKIIDVQKQKYGDTNPHQPSQSAKYTGIQYISNNKQQSQYCNCVALGNNKIYIENNGITFQLVQQLHKQNRLKSQALQIANQIITKLQQNIQQLSTDNQQLVQQIKQYYSKIIDLQQKINMLQNSSASIQDKQITKQNKVQPLKQMKQYQSKQLISQPIFKQIINKYQDILVQITTCIQKYKQQFNNQIAYKLYVNDIGIQDSIFVNNRIEKQKQKDRDDEFSKITYQTWNCSKDSRDTSQYKSSNKYMNNNDNMIATTHLQYQQIIQTYQQYINTQSQQLHTSITYIHHLSQQLKHTHQYISHKLQQLSLIPLQIYNSSQQQYNKIIDYNLNKYNAMKKQNQQLINVIEQIVAWIMRNSKDKGIQFKNIFGNIV